MSHTSPAVDSDSHQQSNQRWMLVAFLFFLGWVFMYADRTILNPVQTMIEAEFGLNKAQVGLISSVFFLTYAAMQIPSGILGDRFGRTKLIAIGFAIFGIFTGLTGLAGSFGILLLYRAMAGVGQGFYYGPQYALSSEMIPASHRTVGNAIINSGQAFGITLGLIASSWLAVTLDGGWQLPFFVFSVPTLLVGLAIMVFIKPPPRDKAADVDRPSFASLFRNRNLVLTFVMVFCSLYGFFVMVTWLPVYLEEARGIARADTGFITSLVAWTSVPAGLFFGWLSDRLGARRPVILTLVPLAIASILLMLGSTGTTVLVIALIMYGLTGKLATDPMLIALVADNVDRRVLSTAFGLFNFVGMSSAILAPYITGFLRDSTDSWAIGFYLAAGLLAIGWVAVLFIREDKDAIRAAQQTQPA